MQYKRVRDFIVIRLDEDDLVIENLKKVCLREKVKNGVILSAVGGMKRGTLVYRRGCKGDFNEHFEIIGNGNIGKVGDKIMIHFHITGGNERNVRTGHLIEGVVSVFLEIVVQALHGFAMERKLNESLVLQKVLNPYVMEP